MYNKNGVYNYDGGGGGGAAKRHKHPLPTCFLKSENLLTIGIVIFVAPMFSFLLYLLAVQT